LLLTYKENVHSTQMYIPLKPLFSRHKGIGVQFTDEPTGNLDSKNSQEVLALLQTMSAKYQQTILMITHNKNHASAADRIFNMSDGVLKELGVSRK
jgi:predicted ABC-type transport system involved in lysophospholipase L1 biosynthesis ATPase subunit